MTPRDQNGRFKKGHSGNPNGRPPKDREERYRELISESVSFAQFKRIIKQLADKAEEGDLQAIKLLFEYVIGKPAQRLQHSGPDGGPIESKDVTMTSDERHEAREAFYRRVSYETGERFVGRGDKS